MQRPITLTGAAAIGLALFTGCGLAASGHPRATVRASGRFLRWKKPPAMIINPQKTYIADFLTSAGRFQMTLFAKRDPHATNNFIFLAKHHFFNGDTFFRVIKTFMIQTGDPLNRGTGGPGYSWKGGLPHFPYQPGIVAMANRGGNRNTNGSQFFICTGPASESLNVTPNYTELGRITRGMRVVEKIAAGKVRKNPKTRELSQPVHPVVIREVSIHVR